VTASNFAGMSEQPSHPLTIVAKFKLGRLARNPGKGTASLGVAASGTGKVILTGKGLVAQRRRVLPSRRIPERRFPPFATTLLVKAKGQAEETLNATGEVKVRAKVAFRPTGGKALKKTRTITLKKRLHP
jgi:hypothetical protein